jgi:flagellar hook-associated protein 1
LHNYNVHIDGAGTLVAGGMALALKTGPYKDSKGEITKNLEVFFEKRPSIPITKKIKDGSLGAAIYARNNVVGTVKDKLDNIAFNLVKVVNSIHSKGFVHREIPFGSSENPPTSDSFGPTTGINFFRDIDNSFGASSRVDLSDEVKSDLSNISTGILPNKPGDNRVALAISKVPHQKILDNGRATMEEEYLKSISDIGMASGKAKLNFEQSQGILAQIKSLKERISGVSLDEEATNLIRYQNAYQSSAKVIKESDDMFKAVLDLKR